MLILLTTKYYSDYQIRGYEMGVYFNLQWKHGNVHKRLVGKPEGRASLGN